MPISKPVRALLDAIGKVEAGKRGYNAIYLPAERKLGKQNLTTMTIKEVQDLQARMVKESASSACGRYQFIRKTLAALKRQLRIANGTRFDAALQDRLAVRLLEGRGLAAFLSGGLSREAFANNLAKEWASLPVVTPINGKKVGQSYYAGDGLNHALVKPAAILALVDGLKVTPKPVPKPEPPETPAEDRVLVIGDEGALVTALQQELKRLKYHSGGIDGIFGNLTRDAVNAFKADNGLPTDGRVTDEVWETLKTADVRPTMEKRKDKTLDELAEDGSEIAKSAKKGKKGAIATFITAIGAMFSSALERAGDLIHFGPLFEQVRPYFETYGPWLFGTALLGLAGFIYWQSRKSGEARVRDHREAKTL